MTASRWPYRFLQLAIALAAIIHSVPLIGVLGAERLQGLYGIAIDDPSVLLLLRHRAVLFGLLGGLAWLSLWRPSWQPLAIVASLVSLASFLLLAMMIGDYHPALDRLVWVDLAVFVLLLTAWVIALPKRQADVA